MTTIYPIGSDTYLAEWTGGRVVVSVSELDAGFKLAVVDGSIPDGLDGAVMRCAIVNVHLDRLADQAPIVPIRCKTTGCANEGEPGICPYDEDVESKVTTCNCCATCRQACAEDI